MSAASGVSVTAKTSSVPVSSSSRWTGAWGPATTNRDPPSARVRCARRNSRSIVESMNPTAVTSAITSSGDSAATALSSSWN
jgi:hypothetical protein